MRFLLLALINLYLLLLPFLSLGSTKSFNQYLQEKWSIEDGLLQVVGNTIAQDHDGYIWIGAQFGLSRFDGVRFRTFTEKDSPYLGSYVQKLFVDSKGKVWIGSNRGLALYQNNAFHPVFISKNNEPDKINSLNVFNIAETHDGHIIINTRQGSFIVVNDKIDSFPLISDQATYGLLALDGEVWIGGVGKITRFKGNKTKVISLPNEQKNLRVENIQKHHGKLWLGTTSGLFQYNGSDIVKYYQHDMLSNTPITSMLQDSDNILWIGTNKGLFRLKEEAIFEFIPNSHPKAFKVLLSMFEDQEKNIWLGSYVHGIAKLKKAFAQSYGVESGLSEPIVWSIQAKDNGDLYVGTNNGLEYFSQQQFKTLVPAKDLPHPVVYTQLLTPEGLIIGTRAGAALYNDEKVTIPDIFKPLAYSRVRGIVRIEKGEYYFATDNGLFHSSNGETLLYDKDNNGNTISLRLVYKTKDNRILVGALDGVYQYDNKQLVKLYPKLKSLENFDVTAIYEDDNDDFVFGTSSSGLIYQTDSEWFHFSDKKAKLPTAGGFFIAKDSNQYIWVSSFNALYRFPFKELAALKNKEISGLSVDQILDDTGRVLGAEKSACCTGAGTAKGFILSDNITLPSRTGIIKINTSMFSKNELRPKSIIESLTTNNKTYIFEPNKVKVLDKGSRDIAFNFTTFSFNAPKNNLLQYKLVGYDEKWKSLQDSTRRSATYTNLPHGQYHFIVKGTNDSGIWGPESLPFYFSIKPYYYETWYFYSVVLLLLIALPFGLYRLRILSLEKQKHKLEREVNKKTNIILAVSEAGQQITAGLDLLETMDTIYANINSFMSSDSFGIGLCSEDGKYLVYDYSISHKKRFKPYKRNMSDIHTLPVWCVRNRMPIFINDIETDAKKYIPEYDDNDLDQVNYVFEDGTESQKSISMIYVPIIYDDKALGLIGIQSHSKGQYQSQHIDMLQSIASYTAIALINTKMHDKIIGSEQREKQTFEEQKKLAESANLAKSQFLATMSHEIRTPMNGVIGMVELLTSTALTESQKHYVETISRSGKILLNIINDILDYSKIEAGKMELESVAFNLQALVSDCANFFEVISNEKGIIFLDNILPNVPLNLIGDPTRITQLITNLLGNAFKFTESGIVALKVEGIAPLNLDEIELKFSVQDTGIGIPLQFQQSLFNSFHQSDSSTTRKYGGTGLGLAICKRLVKMMKGDINVISREDKGSTFYFTIKLLRDKSYKLFEPKKMEHSSERDIMFLGDNSVLLENLSLHMQMKEITIEHSTVLELDEDIFKLLDKYRFCLVGKCLIQKSSPKFVERLFNHSKYGSNQIVLFGQSKLDNAHDELVHKYAIRSLNNPTDFSEFNDDNFEENIERAKGIEVSNKTANYSQLKVIVAEDNEVNKIVIISMLAKINVTPIVVSNGLEFLESIKLEDNAYDLILMDCEMPEMDGFQATREFRAYEKNGNLTKTPIIALTAHTMQEHEKQVYEAGMDFYLTKPITLNGLVSAIETYFPRES